jgi:hypothetical protein
MVKKKNKLFPNKEKLTGKLRSIRYSISVLFKVRYTNSYANNLTFYPQLSYNVDILILVHWNIVESSRWAFSKSTSFIKLPM